MATKLLVRKVEKIEETKCGNCRHFLFLLEKIGLCPKRIRIMYSSMNCPMHEFGEPKEAGLDEIAEFYLIFKQLEEDYKKYKDTIRDIIIYKVDRFAETDNYTISVKEIRTERLDTDKVREYLSSQGILDEFVKVCEHYRVDVKKKILGGGELYG